MMRQSVKETDLMRSINIKTVVIVLCFMGIISMFGSFEKCHIKKNGVFSIATIRGIDGARGGCSFTIIYSFSNKEYHGFAVSSEVFPSDEGSRFFIQVLPNNPKRFWLTDIEVPYDITEAPPDGWKELPVLDW